MLSAPTLKSGFRVAMLLLLSVLLTASVADFAPSASPSHIHGAPLPVLRRVKPRQAPLLRIVDQPDILQRHKILADRVLRALPATCRRSLKNFYVRYEGSDRRGYGGKTTIVLDGNVTDKEFVGLLVHECGHVIHANLAGTEQSGASEFRDGAQVFYRDAPLVRYFRISWERENVLRAGAREEDFASGYAKSDAFEDFAEFLVAYVLHPALIEERAKETAAIAVKLAWMQRELPLPREYSAGGIQEMRLRAIDMIARSRATWEGSVPWDMTKLPMEFAGNISALTAQR